MEGDTFDQAGELRRIQVVYLNPTTGAKADVSPVKRTFGAGASHVPAVLRGNGAGASYDVILVEGPEDAIALWCALDGAVDVGATLGAGSLHKPKIAAGTRVLLFGDNDVAGRAAIERAAIEHRSRGAVGSTTYPPDEIKDGNELLRQGGPAAVLTAVEGALAWVPAVPVAAAIAPTFDGSNEVSLAAGERLADEAVSRFLGKLRDCHGWPGANSPGKVTDFGLDFNIETDFPLMAIVGTPGLGKTRHIENICAEVPELTFVNVYCKDHAGIAETSGIPSFSTTNI